LAPASGKQGGTLALARHLAPAHPEDRQRPEGPVRLRKGTSLHSRGPCSDATRQRQGGAAHPHLAGRALKLAPGLPGVACMGQGYPPATLAFDLEETTRERLSDLKIGLRLNLAFGMLIALTVGRAGHGATSVSPWPGTWRPRHMPTSYGCVPHSRASWPGS